MSNAFRTALSDAKTVLSDDAALYSKKLSDLFERCAKHNLILPDIKTLNTILLDEDVFFIDFDPTHHASIRDTSRECNLLINITLFSAFCHCRHSSQMVLVDALLEDSLKLLKTIDLDNAYRSQLCNVLARMFAPPIDNDTSAYDKKKSRLARNIVSTATRYQRGSKPCLYTILPTILDENSKPMLQIMAENFELFEFRPAKDEV